jgi:death-on-curing protein
MIEYLSEEQILALHNALLEATGGEPGLRDRGMLESALARPAASFGGQDLYASLAAKAAALMHSLISNHPFVDGNKRVAVAAMELFLIVNHHRLDADNEGLEEFTLAAAASQIGLEEIRIWLDQRIRRVSR